MSSRIPKKILVGENFVGGHVYRQNLTLVTFCLYVQGDGVKAVACYCAAKGDAGEREM
jgi:hypothetical protein